MLCALLFSYIFVDTLQSSVPFAMAAIFIFMKPKSNYETLFFGTQSCGRGLRKSTLKLALCVFLKS